MSLDERSAMEKRCLKTLPKPAENIDANWIQSTGNWFYSHGSRLQFYRLAAEVSQMSIAKINEDDLYYRGCMKLEWDPGVFKYNLPNLKTGGTSVVTLTDSRSFFFHYACYDEGEATWGVTSTVDDLDKKTEKLIHEHAKSLGFNEKYFTEMEFEQCEKSNSQRVEL